MSLERSDENKIKKRSELIEYLSEKSEDAARVRYAIYLCYGDIKNKKSLEVNKNTFAMLTNEDLYIWAYHFKDHDNEYALASANKPKLDSIFNSIESLHETVEDAKELVGTKERVNKEDILKALTEFVNVPYDDEEIDYEDIDSYLTDLEDSMDELTKTVKDIEEENKSALGITNNDTVDEELEEIARILAEAGAVLNLTEKEKAAFNSAFRNVRYSFEDAGEFSKYNFIAVKRSEYSATFILCTYGLLLSKREKVIETFLSFTGYSAFESGSNMPFDRQDWWAIDCITNYAKFNSTEFPGSMLFNYPNLGNLRKMWVGNSVRGPVLMDFLDAQNSFNMIGGKSRSGKTCLSHNIIIQAICGDVLPTFLDWKPEGSVLYARSGFHYVHQDVFSWLNQKSGKHLLNIMDALAWLASMTILWRRRGLQGKNDFDKRNLANPDDPVVLYVFDELETFMSTLSSIIPDKKEDQLSSKEKAAKEVVQLAKRVLVEVNGCLAACATYGIKFMVITQNIRISDNVWSSKGWGNAGVGKEFRQRMLNTFWGKGNLSGTDCPIVEKQERKYIDEGHGRFGWVSSTNDKVFRALRIDNTKGNDAEGIDAGSVLYGCIRKLGKQLPNNRYSFFESLINEAKNREDFIHTYSKIKEAFDLDVGVNLKTGKGDYADTELANNLENKMSKGKGVENNLSSNKNGRNADRRMGNVIPINGSVALQHDLIKEEESNEHEELIKKAGRGRLLDSNESINDISMEGAYRDEIVSTKVSDLDDIRITLVKNNDSGVVAPERQGDRRVLINSKYYRPENVIFTGSNTIDCENVLQGKLARLEKIWMQTPAGATKYINRLWKNLLIKIVKAGYKKANITRIGLYGNNMYVNGKIVSLSGIIGGAENIRLRDIVSFRTLFKEFFMIRELRIDTDLLQVAMLELGQDTIQKMFKLAPKLETVLVIMSGNRVVKYNRLDQSNYDKLEKEITKRNNIDMAYQNTKSGSWDEQRFGDNIWGARLAGSYIGKAGKMFTDKNNPSVGRSALTFTLGVAIGVLGGIPWALYTMTSKAAGLVRRN